MTTYRALRLTPQTPLNEQIRLLEALKGVEGVESAKLQLDAHTFTVVGDRQSHLRREAIYSVALSAGFPVTMPLTHFAAGI